MGAPEPSVQDADRLPRRFGRYLLFDRIGRGGMADIYLARAETELGAAKRLVIKQILVELCRDERFAKMLIDEAKLVAGLRHKNVAQVLDLGREGERLFIGMEYVEGYDLHQLLRRLSKQKLPFPAEFALLVVREMLAALDFAHRAKDEEGRALGIVHRDVSPSNVLISFEGEVKLCDFGIAKALGEPSVVGGVVGKAAYMSPEHARGEATDSRSDIFSAGIILYELCSGRRLYKGSEEHMLALARAAEIPPLRNRGLAEHDMLAAIVARALAVDPDARYATAAQFLSDLDDYAMKAKLFASPIRFGSFLSEHFEEELVRGRRERERAAQALEAGPAAEIAPVSPEPASAEPAEEIEIKARPAPPPERGDATEPTGSLPDPTESAEGPSRRPRAPISDEAMAMAEDDTRRLQASSAERDNSGVPWAVAIGAGLIFFAVVIAVWLVVAP